MVAHRTRTRYALGMETESKPLPYAIRFALYMACPRGSGDAEDHRRKFLVHKVMGDQLVCMDAELAHRMDAARGDQ